MIYIFAIVFSIGLIIFVLNLVRKNQLDEKYSVLWFFASIIVLIVSVYPKIIIIVANKFNVYYPPSLMFLFGIIILGAYIIHITTVITKQNKMIIKLTQELGILKEKIERIERKKND